jgi:hypothetical protein
MRKTTFTARGVSLAASAVAVALTLSACGEGAPKEKNEMNADEWSESQLVLGTRVHKMPMIDPNAITPLVHTGGPLTYFGGRVVSNMQVVQVLYGAGSYNAQVAGTSTPSIATFYQGILNSAYVDWFDGEYNTVSPAGTKTNQHIGRGSFSTRVQITPAASRNGSTITDAQIQAELAAQITAGTLPAPTTDAAGNNNTYYAVFFPPGKTINQGGTNSCVAGGFCAYHGTIANANGHEVYYGVHPDMQAGSGCATGCGTSTVFNNYTSVASHEMTETITDCEVGLATVAGPPLAWYDNVNGGGEIGDICNGQQATIVGGDGVTYTIQREYSNAVNDCIVSKAVAGNDFSVSVSPASVSVVQGNSTSATVTTATTSGSAQTVSLTVTGQPTGMTATLSPTSVTSGGSSTLSITTTATLAAGTYPLTVHGTATSGAHTAVINVTVTTTGGTCTTTTQLLVNPGFESGTSGWTATAGVLGNGSVAPNVARTGAQFAWLDGYGTTHTDTLSQTVTIPATACTAVFTYWLRIQTAETTTTTAFDKLAVAANTTSIGSFSNLNHNTAYALQTVNLIAFKGTSVTLKFTGTEDSSLQTSFQIDDTAVTVTQ